MTRKQIEAEYQVVDGVIRSPGKFENEQVYAPYFYDAYLDGGADEDDGENLYFTVTNEDIKEFPELNGCTQVILTVDSTGFVWTRTE